MSKQAKQARRRLADPTTYAAMDAAMAEGDARFRPQINPVIADIKALVAGRKMNDLSGEEMVRFMALRAELDSLSIQQMRFIEADLACRLGPDGGSELVDA